MGLAASVKQNTIVSATVSGCIIDLGSSVGANIFRKGVAVRPGQITKILIS